MVNVKPYLKYHKYITLKASKQSFWSVFLKMLLCLDKSLLRLLTGLNVLEHLQGIFLHKYYAS